MANVLVFSPHPDDDILGCGGSMLAHLQKGDEVFVAYVTHGDAPHSQFHQEEFKNLREQETFAAAKCLGLKKENLFFMDEKPWQLDAQEVRFKSLDLVRQVRPSICYIPHALDAHADHKVVSAAALDAINLAPGKWFRKYALVPEKAFSVSVILAYEVWTPLAAPSFFQDITPFLEKKMAALKEHQTQSVARYERASRGLSAFRAGMGTGLNGGYCEAFEIIRNSSGFSMD